MGKAPSEYINLTYEPLMEKSQFQSIFEVAIGLGMTYIVFLAFNGRRNNTRTGLKGGKGMKKDDKKNKGLFGGGGM